MRRVLSFISMLFVALASGLGLNSSAFGYFIQEDLYFGRNIPGGGKVSASQFQTFVDSVVTPRFPAGLTLFDANGQFRTSSGATM